MQPDSHSPDLSEKFRADARLNPYYLPWILRGILEDERLNKIEHLRKEVEDLRLKFEEWEPTTRIMKELKFRLEPIRARL